MSQTSLTLSLEQMTTVIKSFCVPFRFRPKSGVKKKAQCRVNGDKGDLRPISKNGYQFKPLCAALLKKTCKSENYKRKKQDDFYLELKIRLHLKTDTYFLLFEHFEDIFGDIFFQTSKKSDFEQRKMPKIRSEIRFKRLKNSLMKSKTPLFLKSQRPCGAVVA